MSDDISTSSKWTAVIACLAVWTIVCLPVWLLTMGFAGTFILPTLATDATDAFMMSLLFCIFFYGLLLIAGGMAWGAVTDDLRDRNKLEKTEDVDAAN